MKQVDDNHWNVSVAEFEKAVVDKTCKGKNCDCTDHTSHSDECLKEHASTIDNRQLQTPCPNYTT